MPKEDCVHHHDKLNYSNQKIWESLEVLPIIAISHHCVAYQGNHKHAEKEKDVALRGFKNFSESWKFHRELEELEDSEECNQSIQCCYKFVALDNRDDTTD